MSEQLKKFKLDMALALCPPGNSNPLVVDVIKVYWTSKAVSVFFEIAMQLSKQSDGDNLEQESFVSLPTGALRNLLHSELSGLLSTSSYLGLNYSNLYRKEQALCCLIKKEEDYNGNIKLCMEEWVEVDLTNFIELHNVSDHLREEIYGLLDDDSLISVSNEKVQLFPWGVDKSGSLTAPREGYPLSANDIAAILEGHEIFPELPPVRRLVGTNNNKAELITLPITDNQEGRFSLVCEISIETLPAASSPIIYVNFKKRRWLDSLSAEYTRSRTKNGYFIDATSNRAYNFQLEKTRLSNWIWEPDSAFNTLRRKFGLEYSGAPSVSFCSDANHFVGLAHDYESEGDSLNKIGSGVPEKDRIDAFRIISQKLSLFGFSVFDNFERVKNSIAAYSGILYFSKFVKDRDKELKSAAADSLHLGEDLPDELFRYSDLSQNDQDEKVFLPDLIQAYLSDPLVAEHISGLTLYILTNSPAESSLVKRIAGVLFGDLLEIKSIALPDEVHGPRDALPASEVKNKHQRKDARQKKWLEHIDNIPNKNRALCLIQAPKFYETGSGVKVDDEINKAAAKLAFTSSSGIPVQYLLPPDKRGNSTNKVEKYVLNAQQALLDLVFGHMGLLPGLSKRVEHYHSDESSPKFLYGINIYAATTETRAKNAEIAVASRVNVVSGVTEVKIGHCLSDGIVTEWLSFTKAIKYLTQRCMSTLSLGKSFKDRQELFQRFCKDVLDDAEKNTPLAYVYIKAEGGRKYWNLLTDTGISKFTFDAKARWPSLRIIRVREQAPKLLQDKVTDGHDKPTTTVSLFKVLSSDLPVFWSLGEPVQKYTRGLSCYRTLTVSQAHPVTKEISVKEFAPDIGQTMRPNAAELVLISVSIGDDHEKVAQFSGSLRRGVMPARLETWVKTPSPLFVINKLEEYLKL